MGGLEALSGFLGCGGMAIAVIIGIAFLIIVSAIKVIREYERAVVFRLGRLLRKAKGPGIFILWPIIDRMVKIDLRTITLDVPPQDVITKDNVTLKVNAVVYFRVMEPNKAVVDVEDYLFATSQLAQTTLRSILGQHELDDLLGHRDKINAQLQDIIDQQTDPWGIKVSLVEVKHIDLPVEMQRAMAKQAEAERERRAKVINAEGEYQAAQRLIEASRTLEQSPVSIQLRYLQTLREIAAENNSTTLFPLPIDLFRPFIEHLPTIAKALDGGVKDK